MIQAIFQKNKKEYSYSVTGHAGFDLYGKDIVCAAVSALYTVITNVLDDRVIIIKDKVVIKEADIVSITLFNTLLRGLRSIEEQYPEHIQVTEE